MLGKRYSIFVSSTFEDLRAERSVVFDAILANSGIPVGMEQFPAGMPKTDLVEGLIDQCDYLVVLSKGKYGSIELKSNVSYTEHEVRYAILKGIPVIPFVIKDLGRLPHSDVDSPSKLIRRFHDFLKSELDLTCRFFETPNDLRSAVGDSLNQMYQLKPMAGLVSGAATLSRGPLEGTWQFRPIADIGIDQKRQIGDGIKRLKIYTDSTYIVLHHGRNGELTMAHGGSYSLEGTAYREKCLFAGTNTLPFVGETHEYTVNVAGNVLHLTKGASGGSFNETWHRQTS